MNSCRNNLGTCRNNPGKKLGYNKIVKCYEYTKEPISKDMIYNERYKDEKRELMSMIDGDSLIHSLTKEIRWAIEEDVETGAQMLANHFNKTVSIDHESMYRYKLPKEAIESYVHSGSGPFESLNYDRGLPQIVFIKPTNNNNNDTTKIRLVIKPNKNNYLHSAEMHKKKVHDYCPCCILNASKAITIGSGDKSSRKTKGRYKREKTQLFYASKGASI